MGTSRFHLQEPDLQVSCNDRVPGYINGLAQAYSISSVLAMDILQSCAKPLISDGITSEKDTYPYGYICCQIPQGPLLLIWIKFNHSIDK